MVEQAIHNKDNVETLEMLKERSGALRKGKV